MNGRRQSAEPEEQVHEIQHGGAVRSAHAVGQRIGPGDHDAPADPQQKHEQHDAAVASGAGQREQRNRDEHQPQDEADFVAFGVEQRPDGQRGDHQSQRLRGGDGAVLRGRQVEPVRQVGQDGAQHGGDHPVDEDGENGGEDEHGVSFLVELFVSLPPSRKNTETDSGPAEIPFGSYERITMPGHDRHRTLISKTMTADRVSRLLNKARVLTLTLRARPADKDFRATSICSS